MSRAPRKGDAPGAGTRAHPATQAATSDTLRHLPLFAGLSDTDFGTLRDMTRTFSIPAGRVLMQEGGPPEAAYVIIQGELEVTARRGEREVLLAVRQAGELVGEMSLLEQAPRSATVRARVSSHLLEVTQSALETLMACSREARWAILGGVAARLRETQALVDHSARLAHLGELAADLAHEINNPAAAIRRSAAQLRAALDALERLTRDLAGADLSSVQLDAIEAVRRSAIQHATRQAPRDALTRGDREDELVDWLEQRQVSRAWEVAETFAAHDWTLDELSEAVQPFGQAHQALAVQLAAATTLSYGLLDEISRSAEGISQRVQAVKERAYLDQAPIQVVDVNHALDTTLLMLRHKMQPGINIRREYAADLPGIEAYGIELNTVWENLIDNALDAMGDQGELVLHTAREAGSVRVDVIDSGPGVAPEDLSRIFEAGFTSKPPGLGSGRGLHIARNIVEARHRGRIEVDSRPGATRFSVVLPIALATGATPAPGA